MLLPRPFRDEQNSNHDQLVEKLTFNIFQRIQGKGKRTEFGFFFLVAMHSFLSIIILHLGRPSTLTSLIKEAKQPEEYIRIASFAVMQGIAYHAWGSEVIEIVQLYLLLINRAG